MLRWRHAFGGRCRQRALAVGVQKAGNVDAGWLLMRIGFMVRRLMEDCERDDAFYNRNRR